MLRSHVALITSLISFWASPCAAVRSAAHAANATSDEAANKPPPLKASIRGHNFAAQGNTGSRLRVADASNQTGAKAPFNPLDYGPEVGKVFAFYYSTASDELATSVEARGYKDLHQVPSSTDLVFDPASGAMVKRGSCPLRLTSQTNYPSDQRKANLRLAELAVCEAFHDSPCKGGAAGCELEIMAPLPYSNEQEPYIGAGMALVAHSLLCGMHKEAWQRSSCAIHRSAAAVSAGLRLAGAGRVELLPLPSPWVDLKLDACYSLGFREAVFAAANRQHYLAGEHYAKKHDVLAWQSAPPEVVFCKDLQCLVQKFEG